jgi:predicted nucleic acid-binding Zn ribbon protein
MVKDEFEEELESYEAILEKERKKPSRNTRILLVILIIVSVIFIIALWRY